MSRYTLFLFLLLQSLVMTSKSLCGQPDTILKLVNPWIGTTQTTTKTMWGAEGGTYPGAVAPFGFMQLTPETRSTEPFGYDYRDSTICFFSCTGHRSGYPNGSSGTIRVMPVSPGIKYSRGFFSRPFSHRDETARPGYYSILFRDNGTFAEATASVHAGLFRFTFPAHTQPKLYLGDMGTIEILSSSKIKGSKLHTLVQLNKDFTGKEEINGGLLLTFPAAGNGENSLLVKIGSSVTDAESTAKNLQKELSTWDFDSYRAFNEKKWLDHLSLVEINDTPANNQSIFYTALYHSFLLPWVVSDVEGKYKGPDRMVHQAKGKNQYGGFSTWDTFRTLHPLLCLLLPDNQNDMILSMLDEFSQSGKLPSGPMTGHHPIPVIVDSYLKGIAGFDSTVAYRAMSESLSREKDEDFLAYREMGYVPFSFPESVTRTVEYAYDDWALAQFADIVMRDSKTAGILLAKSFAYRNLFDPRSLFLLPRNKSEYLAEPGNFGYKEGDKWSYSLFVPHNPVDLINLMGGSEAFAEQLDSALRRQDIFFDNEPVFHVPYLFNYAGRPDKTQEWVREIMQKGFANSPDGLPGNDDLGSMSSWFVFSALGFFPVCPGRPSYDLGSPVFDKATIHLPNRKKFVIRATGTSPANSYVRSSKLNGSALNGPWISHKSILDGGILEVEMGSKPVGLPPKAPVPAGLSETRHYSSFSISGFHLSTGKVHSDQPFYALFRVKNDGGSGTKIVKLLLDGREFSRKNVFVEENETVKDSILCRVYGIGRKTMQLGNQSAEIEVVPAPQGEISHAEVLSLRATPIGSIREKLEFSVQVMNKSGHPVLDTLSLKLDGSLLQQETVSLMPGETKKISFSATVANPGIRTISAGPLSEKFKIYAEKRESKILDISPASHTKGDSLPDRSGLGNVGLLRKSVPYRSLAGSAKPDTVDYIELKPSSSLDLLKNQLTVMAWVYPLKNNQLSDIISKGDHIVMQAGGKTLTFFAGGWGRGVSEAGLPADWAGKWHHIAGVYDGNSLKLYIDGIVSAVENRILPGNLLTYQKWMVKRNEEFPEMRYFKGQVDHIKIFAEPLSESEVGAEMTADQPGK